MHLSDEFDAMTRYHSLKNTCERIGISIAKWTDIINGCAEITPSIAERLAGEYGTSAEFWLNLQRAWDERNK